MLWSLDPDGALLPQQKVAPFAALEPMAWNGVLSAVCRCLAHVWAASGPDPRLPAEEHRPITTTRGGSARST